MLLGLILAAILVFAGGLSGIAEEKNSRNGRTRRMISKKPPPLRTKRPITISLQKKKTARKTRRRKTDTASDKNKKEPADKSETKKTDEKRNGHLKNG